jgi:hypothetical protein
MAKKRSGRFSLEEDRQLIQMAATSATLEEAAAIFRTSADTIEKKSKRLGIQLRRRRDRAEGEEMMGRRSTWTIKDDDQLRVLAASGETSASVAMRLKRSAAGIRRRAINLGIGLAGSTKAPGLKAKVK